MGTPEQPSPGTAAGTPDNDTSQGFPAYGDPRASRQVSSGIYVGFQDSLMVESVNRVSFAVVLSVRVRLLLLDGTVQVCEADVNVPGGTQITPQLIQLAPGYIISATIQGPSALKQGMVWAQVSIVRGVASGALYNVVLLAGYPEYGANLSYPNGLFAVPAGVPGNIGTLNWTAAAGAEFVCTIPSNTRIRVWGVAAQFQTSAVVANRTISIAVKIGGAIIAFLGAYSAAITASQTIQCMWSPCYGTGALQTGLCVQPWPPDISLKSGDVVTSVTALKDAADQWSNIALWGEIWAVPDL